MLFHLIGAELRLRAPCQDAEGLADQPNHERHSAECHGAHFQRRRHFLAW